MAPSDESFDAQLLRGPTFLTTVNSKTYEELVQEVRWLLVPPGDASESRCAILKRASNNAPKSTALRRARTSLMVWSLQQRETMKRILVIEDDKDIVELVKYNLEKDGFQVTTSGDGGMGLAQIRKAPPDLLILDLMLPKLSGLEICKEVRKDVSLNRLPVLILTAKGEEADRVVGLELGADDYVTKPFSPRELVARVKALLRRSEPATPSEKPIEIGALRIDPAAYRVTRGGKSVPMSTLEFRLLYFLAARPNRVFTRDQLLDGVWGTERFVTPRSVDVYVRRLREKIETDPQRPLYMKTIRGAGYLFETRAS
jgi:phosphate regulon transcriptional regulator PhoB